jgi:hypothetical protein
MQSSIAHSCICVITIDEMQSHLVTLYFPIYTLSFSYMKSTFIFFSNVTVISVYLVFQTISLLVKLLAYNLMIIFHVKNA